MSSTSASSPPGGVPIRGGESGHSVTVRLRGQHVRANGQRGHFLEGKTNHGRKQLPRSRGQGGSSLVNERLNLAVQDIEQLLCELEVKFTTYEKAHDKIVGSATDAQIGREDYGNLIAVEHEDLLKKLEDSDQKLKLKKKALDRAAENAGQSRLHLLPNTRSRSSRVVGHAAWIP